MTWTGTFLSLIIRALVFVFALIKLEQMIDGKNPTINTNEMANEEEDKYRTK